MPTDEPWENRSGSKVWMDRTRIGRGAEHHQELSTLLQS